MTDLNAENKDKFTSKLLLIGEKDLFKTKWKLDVTEMLLINNDKYNGYTD